MGLTVIVLLVFSVSSTLACHCPSRYTQQAVCDADIVIKALVEDVNVGIAYTMYSVVIGEVYKGEEILRELSDRSKVSTPNDSGMCGPILLRSGASYFISGMVYDGVMMTTLCDFVEEDAALSESAARGLSGDYMSNCDCKIPYEWSPVRRGKRRCGQAPRGCSGDTICAKNQRGRCRWEEC